MKVMNDVMSLVMGPCPECFDVVKPCKCSLKKALSDLVDLKYYKDKYGKDEYYREVQPKVWKQAFKILGRSE